MNVENIDKVIEAIRRQELARFDMGTFGDADQNHPCGTCACIGGFAYMLSANKTFHMFGATREALDEVITKAAAYLGLDADTADILFHPDADGRSWGTLTSEEAIETLEKLKLTGAVDWSHASFDRVDYSVW